MGALPDVAEEVEDEPEDRMSIASEGEYEEDPTGSHAGNATTDQPHQPQRGYEDLFGSPAPLSKFLVPLQ